MTMTKKQAEQIFKTEILPELPKNRVTIRCTWNDWTDSLCKNSDISDGQYNNWVHPNFCK